MKNLDEISKKEFEELKELGMLWEFYPECECDVYEFRTRKDFKKIVDNFKGEC